MENGQLRKEIAEPGFHRDQCALRAEHGVAAVCTLTFPRAPDERAEGRCVGRVIHLLDHAADIGREAHLHGKPEHFARKIERAAKLKGPRLILALAPCPTGWDYDPQHSVEIGHLVVKTGLWPLKEYVDGKTVHTLAPHPRVPVEEYLKLQGRYRHLFEPARNEAVIAEIQAGIDAYWAAVD